MSETISPVKSRLRTRIARHYALAAGSILLLALLSHPALAQQNGGNAKPPAKAVRTLTNDSVASEPSQPTGGAQIPPGLIKCDKDLQCFLSALDRTTPASVKRTETAKEGTAILTMDSSWSATQCKAGRCTVSFQVDFLDAKVNEQVVSADPKARADVEAGLAKLKKDFEPLRGTTQTCSLSINDLKVLMTSSRWTLTSLRSATIGGKTCSGPMFDAPVGRLPDGKE